MTTSVSKIPLRQVKSVQDLLKNEFALSNLDRVKAKHMNPERMMRVMANAIRKTPKLAQCEPMSFLGALMECSALGLEPNTAMGHAYLVPFDNRKKGVTEVQVIVGYKGLIDLARRSGHITSISANVHYSDDELWEYEEGTESKLRHIPGPQDGEKLHVYAIAKFTAGGHAYVVLPWSHVIKIRNASQNWKTAVKFNSTAASPWTVHEDAMAKKTAIRALSKYLPLSVEFMAAAEVDHDDGAKVNYAEYALHPESGPVIDGEAIQEGEEDPAVDHAPEPKQEEKPKPKSEPKTQKKPEPEPESAPEPSDDEMTAKLRELVSEELDNADDLGAVESVMELWRDQIEQQGDDFIREMGELADERREALA